MFQVKHTHTERQRLILIEEKERYVVFIFFTSFV